MLPSEVRTLLLAQHAVIRDLAEHARAAAERSPPADELRIAIDTLHVALIEHNHDEQRLLDEALPAADAWGEVRRVSMDDHHRREHVTLREALAAAASLEDGTALRRTVFALLDDLYQHMEMEERVLLHANVLRDDVCSVDPFGG